MTSTDRQHRLILAFLEEGLTELADGSFDAIRAAVERTPQQTAIGLRRTHPMLAFIRPAAMAAVFVGIALIGVLLLNRPSLSPGGSMTPAPSSPGIATSSATDAAWPSEFRSYRWPGPLAAGRYSTSFTWSTDFEVRFTVPNGWEGRDIEVSRGSVLNLAVALVGNTSADPCTGTLADPPTGQSVADLAAALGAMPGLDASAPRPATLAGYDGLAIDATVDAAAGCEPADFLLWVDPDDSHLPFKPYGPPTWTAEQPNMTISIVDVQGTRLVVSQLWADAATAADRAELQAVVDSIEIGPPTQILTVGPCKLTVTHHGTDLGAPPYAVTLGMVLPEELNGAAPADFSSMAPLDWLDWRGEGWQMMGRNAPGGAGLIPPPGVTSSGFSTRNQQGGPQVGSFVFDAPGVWWARINDGRLADDSGCLRQFPVQVLPMASG